MGENMSMIRAIVKNGTIQPIDPIPPEWSDGREVLVQEAAPGFRNSPEETEQWYRELEVLCAAGDPEDDARLRVALAEAHDQAKATVRRHMEQK
jgi:hypothetical protein